MLLHAHEDAEYEWTFTEGLGKIPRTWILLDNPSTVSIFSNPTTLLSNIRKVKAPSTFNATQE